MPLPNCYVTPPGPGETGARVCETFAEIRARQIGYWQDYLFKMAYCPWPTILETRAPTSSDDYYEGFRAGQFWLDKSTNITYVCEDATPGAPIWNLVGGGSSIIWSRVTTSVPASSTQVVDTVALSGFHMIRYILTAYNDAQSKTKALELTVAQEAGSVNSSVYSKINQLDIGVDPVVSGSNNELQITNNELFPVQIDLIKATFG